jgi:cation transport protein ChaC
MILKAGIDLHVLSDAELQASIHKTLQRSQSSADIWIFAYGSLIWNPIFTFAEHRVGIIYGLHRRFCLWTPLGRGTPENPGLVLGLDRGGSCRGVMFRIAAADVLPELLLVWRREMVVGSYIPRWVSVFDGQQTVKAIAFVSNRQHPHYAGKISLERTVHSLATAGGQLGSCADYLIHTVNGLMQAGIQDRQLLWLREQVIAQRQRQSSVSNRLVGVAPWDESHRSVG